MVREVQLSSGCRAAISTLVGAVLLFPCMVAAKPALYMIGQGRGVLLGSASTNSRHDGTLRQLKLEVGRHQVRAREAYRAPDGK